MYSMFTTDIKLKAVLYAIPLLLTPFADKAVAIMLQNEWPTLPMMAGCAVLGVISAAIGLRAYFDGSYERSIKTNGGSSGQPPVLKS